MTITSWKVERLRDETTRFRVTSDLVPTSLTNFVQYHWYADGRYIGKTVEGQIRILLTGDQQQSIECIDTLDPDFDPLATENIPRGFPASRQIYWRRSLDADVNHYRVLLKRGTELAGSVGKIEHRDKQWRYYWTTPRLEDLLVHEVSLRAVDQNGRVGAESLPFSQLIVRVPDAPEFDVALDEGTGRVTFSEV